jgi:diguanylate cyclase (GGDEF)-like protein
VSNRERRPDERDSATRKTRPSANLRAPLVPLGTEEAFLIIIYGVELGKRVPLSRANFDIGRSSKNDLTLDEDAVSRHHARIVWDKNDAHRIVDLDSTNGIAVNDVRVKEAPLADGDQIRIGRTILKFMTGANVETHYHEEVYRLMTVDALTKAYNKRYFDEALERECNRAKRHDRPLSLVLLDIDHFKAKNDTYGHMAGDAILRQIAQAVGPKLRREDIFARVGGEEFAVLLPEVPLAGARITAERIRKMVESAVIVVDGDTLGERVACTVSCGFACFDPNAPTPEALYKEADAFLYKAKSSGRNCIAGP